MKISDLADSIAENIEQNKSEDESLGLIRSGRMSGQMMTIADEVQRELDEELLDECDESFREAA